MIPIDELLNPIREDAPAGVNLRLDAGDTTFRDLEEKRRQEEAAFSASGEAKYADWNGVARLCQEALEAKSKDLQLCAYLAEAWSYTDGFAGLQAGLSLTRQTLFKYWYLVHPGHEEDEILLPVRAKWLSWM
ncbi:MAG: type VI secretion system ImpA family N-terminal domain-containing protein, partial [Gemmatimonadetes bacterium]|nr:type VI secretion system ImpA family N-terminal domain-containing protein [Gemmatimonadota bacterium]